MRTDARHGGGRLRLLRAFLQLGLTLVGTLGLVWGLYEVATIPPTEPGGSGFAAGMAVLLYGLYALVGYELVVLGLLVPQHPGTGVHFSARQRSLLAYGAVAPVVSVLAVPVGATLVSVPEPVNSVLVAVLVVVLVSGPVATGIAVAQKLRLLGRHRTPASP